MKMTFDEKSNSYVLDAEETSVKGEVVEMEAPGWLSGIAKMEIAGIPVGAAAAGGATAYVVDSLMDRFLPQVTGSMANILAAFVITRFGSKLVGADVAKYASLFLVYEAVRDPIEGALGGVLGKMKSPAGAFRSPGILEQASAVASGYYDAAFRRG